MHVFYSRNRFAVRPQHRTFSDPVATCHGPESMLVYSFLKRLPSASIALLTSLTLVFPPIKPTYLLPEQDGWQKWLWAIDILANNANLKALRLEICMTDITWARTREGREGYFDTEYETQISEAYLRLVEPLVALRGLGHFPFI
jgi:hypothetical protein